MQMNRLTLMGLCPTCKYVKVIQSARGSRFVLCHRAKFDERFDKYPRLPVLTCVGYEPQPQDNE